MDSPKRTPRFRIPTVYTEWDLHPFCNVTTRIFLLLLLCFSWGGARAEDVFHQVDTQKTFWEGRHGDPDGPLAVPGTNAITGNVATLAQIAFVSTRIKSIASRDRRFPSEGKTYSNDGVAGPRGTERIPEVELYEKEKQVSIPHNLERDGKLLLVPFDAERIAADVRDPNIEIILEKNGKKAYDVFANPRAEQVYEILSPKRIFVYGVATDWCVEGVVNSLLNRRYRVFVVEDAIAGLEEKLTREKIAKFVRRGATLIKTADVVKLFPEEAAKLPPPRCNFAPLDPAAH